MVHLKSLTLKGFKSFADPTTLEFEPGITAVVGPNGSGKSNIVDAIAWVLGAQGPSVVRSNKMDDVIFAGTTSRSALGRAEVSLVIDNSSRKIPVEFNEITITRTLFRTGESEYALNGVTCRLLDIQELLSDSGVGRQQHVIIGQGQLDAVLQARPEDRRAIIEEAAGILKYRRRRERSERRLEASEADLVRLGDLARELNRQIRPLERQARAALRHEELTLELSAIGLYAAGQQIRAISARLSANHDRERTVLNELAGIEEELSRLGASITELEERADDGTLEALGALVVELSKREERARSLRALLFERRRARQVLADSLLDASAAEGPFDGVARIEAELAATDAEVATLAPEWERLIAKEGEHLSLLARHHEAYPEPDRAVGDEAARLRLEVATARSQKDAAQMSQIRAAEQLAALEHRREEHADQMASALERIASLERGLGEALGRARDHEASELTSRKAAEDAEAARRAGAEQLHEERGRVEALELALGAVRDRAGVDRFGELSGVLGTLLDVVEVDDEAAAGFEAAVEPVLDAVIVSGSSAARAAIAKLRVDGVAGAILPALGLAGKRREMSAPPPGGQWLRDRVHTSNEHVAQLLDELIGDVVFAPVEFERALELAIDNPRRTIVTRGGERFSPSGWRIGKSRTGATMAALERAKERAEEKFAALSRLEDEVAATRARAEAARASAASATHDVGLLRASLDQERERLAHLESEASRMGADLARAKEALSLRDEALEECAATLAQLEARLIVLQHDEDENLARTAEATAERRRLEDEGRALAALRRELEVRAASLEERRDQLLRRREEAVVEKEAVAARLEADLEKRAALERDVAVLDALITWLDERCEDLSQSAGPITAAYEQRAAERRARTEQVIALRALRERHLSSAAALREERQRLEIERAEDKVRCQAAIEALYRDFGAEPEGALSAPPPEMAEHADPMTRARQIEDELEGLGPVNPLARVELTELTERQRFVEAQLGDVRAARRELHEIIAAVDAEIVRVFTEAFADVDAHFQSLFETLFPGGSARLLLTDPSDLLGTGVEVEARPPGRNVRRISLLSGGERSLVALAFLFGVFRSRPSPFYILDEVEAALDEANLRRFLGLLEEFRAEAQLVIVTHQKLTMEVGDCLYGVSMQPGGATKVVSERLDRRRDVRGAERARLGSSLELA